MSRIRNPNAFFLSLQKRQVNKDLLDGWTLDKFKDLPEADKMFLLQFFLEICGDNPKQFDERIYPHLGDEAREARRYKNRRMRLNKDNNPYRVVSLTDIKE